jgi:zinc protease
MKTLILFVVLSSVLHAQKASDMKFITEKNQSDIITFRIQFQTGAVDDPAGKDGLNTLTAMMIGEGGSKAMSFQDVTKALFPMAAEIDYAPEKEVTTFIGNCHADSVNAFYALYASLILSPRFDDSDFRRNKESLINYIKNTLRNTDDENLGKKTLQVELFPNHPYGHINEGTVKTLEGITLDDVRSFYAQHYGKNNVVIGLAGNYPDNLMKQIDSDFGKLPKVVVGKRDLPKAEVISGLEFTLVQKETMASAVSIGFPIAVNRSDEDFYPLLLANSYLGEHRTFNGVLMNRLREVRGLNYGDYSYIEHFTQEGGTTFINANLPRTQQYFSIWIRPVVPQNALFSVRCALYELNKLVENGIAQDQFELTKAFMINYSKLFIQTQSRRLGFKMDSDWYGTEFYIDKIEKALSKVTRDQVNAVIKKYLQSRNMKIVIVAKDTEILKKALWDGTPTPIFYPSAKPAQDVLEQDKLIEKYPLGINKDKLKMVKSDDLF